MRYTLYPTCIFVIVFFTSSGNATECKFKYWKHYKNTELFMHQESKTYLFSTTHIAVDSDGAPNAYHPDDIGLDYLANAGYPDKLWWKDILVVDPDDPDSAYVQRTGEFAGYFISKTSLQDDAKPHTDPSRYVDARLIPFFVFPRNFYRMQGTGLIGDLGLAINLETKPPLLLPISVQVVPLLEKFLLAWPKGSEEKM